VFSVLKFADGTKLVARVESSQVSQLTKGPNLCRDLCCLAAWSEE